MVVGRMKSEWARALSVIPVFLVTFLCYPQTASNSAAGDTQAHSVAADFLYVSLDAEHCIAVYAIDTVSGDLRFIRKTTVSGEPGSLAVDPARRYLYAAVRSSNSISSFRISSQNADLALINTVHAAGNPVFVGTDKTGKFVLTAYFADSKAAVYSVRDDGGLRDSAVQVFDTEKNAHAIQTDPSNRFAFIPCRTGEVILQFNFDSESGRLTPNASDRTSTPPKTGPRHFAFHPSLPLVYFVNEFSSSVTMHHLDKLGGTLSEVQTIAALPDGFAGTNTGADVHLTPDGKFLYASNRGHESIAAFLVDAISGRMTAIGMFPTEKTPRSFTLDPSGRFLYAAGQGSGRIASYRIDRERGALIPLKIYEAGKNPVWIQAVRHSTEE